MLDCDLNEVTRKVRAAAQQDIENLLSYEWAPTKRPIKGMDRSIPREEVVSPNIGVFRERIEAPAYEYE